MKIIAVEEHFVTESLIKYLHSRKVYPRRDFIEEGGKRYERDWWAADSYMLMDADRPDRALDLGEGRLKDMDDCGITMQVLSVAHPKMTWYETEDAKSLARDINDQLAEVVKKYPSRFGGLAFLAPQDPDFAAGELERAVTKLGLHGAALAGSIRGEYLDKDRYRVILEQADKLRVPIYLHPGPPPDDMIQPYMDYPGLSGALLGYAADASLHAMKLICSGVFDKLPNLQFMLGHLGEALPFWLWRMDSRWPIGRMNAPSSGSNYAGFQKSPSQYFKEHFYVTTSGMFWPPAIEFCCSVMGADRVLFATDYPFEDTPEAVRAIEATPISDEDKEKVCHLNTERLMRLK